MNGRLRAALGLACTLSAGCASALHNVEAGERVPGEDAESLYAELRKVLHEIQEAPSPSRRETMAVEAVKLGQRCEQLAPTDARCEYGLALALGVQAREKPATANDALPLMVTRLERAAKSSPALDHAGPERVLGLVLVRSPGWPAGPGDPASGLEVARRAAERDPAYAPNWLAVAEAADAVGDSRSRTEAANRAATLAEQAGQAGEPAAETWLDQARSLQGTQK
jgi:hypothetical protein